MKNGKIIKALAQEYKLTRDNAKRDAEEALERALENTDYFKITREIAALNFELAAKTARGQDIADETAKAELLEKKRIKILKSLKLSDADFLPAYTCPLCRDEGAKDGGYCKCFQKRYYETLKEILDIESVLPFCFETADFKNIKDENQRVYLEKLYCAFKKYAEKFPDVNTKNALISGGTGVGKSCLMSAVADKIEKRGFNVIYLSAVQLDKLMLNYHTAPSAERGIYLEDIIDCDMLIIDDLGSEQIIRNVTEEYLLHILNEREMHNKPVFITTNLSLAELSDRYNERLFSRMANRKNTIIKEIIGSDLRLS